MKDLSDYLVEKLKLSDVKVKKPDIKKYNKLIYCKDNIDIKEDPSDVSEWLFDQGYTRIFAREVASKNIIVQVFNQTGSKEDGLQYAIVIISNAKYSSYTGIFSDHIYNIEFYDENGKLFDSIGDNRYNSNSYYNLEELI